METVDNAIYELREMDELAAKHSPIHSLHPLAKLVATIGYILVTVSFDKYDLSGLMIMILYPVLLFQIGDISIRTCFYKLRFMLPLVCAVGLFNPFFDKTPLFYLGSVAISGGIVSMITLMLKGCFCLMASFILVATTPIDAICAALRKIHIPGIIVSLILLTYRYTLVMMEEISSMTTAYKLRAPNQKGIHYSAWGSFLGQLLLRSMDRSGELYSSMQLRGFHGEFYYSGTKKAIAKDYIFALTLLCLFILCRSYNVAELLGHLTTGGTV